MDKATFLAKISEEIASLKAELGQDAILDCRAVKTIGAFEESEVFALNELDELWNWLNTAYAEGDTPDEWFVDIYENIPEDKSAYYTGNTIWFDE